MLQLLEDLNRVSNLRGNHCHPKFPENVLKLSEYVVEAHHYWYQRHELVTLRDRLQHANCALRVKKNVAV